MITKILILGAGFGGVYTYLNLKPYITPNNLEITIVDKTNYFLFTPMLHEVATGGLNISDIVEGVREIIANTSTRFIESEITSIDLNLKEVVLDDGKLSYDILVIATGAISNFYKIPGAQKYAYDLKSLHDAFNLRNRIIESLEIASKLKTKDKRQDYLTFAVVGGGATGVELVCEIEEFVNQMYKKHYTEVFNANEIKIILINKGTTLLGNFPVTLQEKALSKVLSKNIKVILNTEIKEVQENKIIFSENESIITRNIIWAAGVRANIPAILPLGITGTSGRLAVDKNFRIKGFTNAFALGDVCAYLDKDLKPLPMLAQVAVGQAKIVANNIIATINNAKLENYQFSLKGLLVSVGQWDAVGYAFGLSFSGSLAWWIWRTIYLAKIPSYKKKLRVAFNWTLNLFYPRDIYKV